jgi:DUF4097 and DUF4098 domain-containing protein YvlB
MRRKTTIFALVVLVAVLLPGTIALAQDFHKTYAIPSGGHITIKNVSGNVKVTGYKINTIEVVATRVGRDKDLVQVEDLSSGDRIDLRVKYPESCNCDASVNFDVRVPSGVDYNYDRLASVSGDVEVNGISGRLKAESVSGNISVQAITGIVSATSVSGDVDVQIAGSGPGDMKFSSVSGNVNITAPANTNADVEMSSVSGSLNTDFPIEIQAASHGPGRSAHGRIGAGMNRLHITTVSGKVSLSRS